MKRLDLVKVLFSILTANLTALFLNQHRDQIFPTTVSVHLNATDFVKNGMWQKGL